MSDRTEKVANLIKEKAAFFLTRESSGSSLLTITRATVSPDLKKATVFITVLPENKEDSALFFVKRKLGELREELKKNLAMKRVPFLEAEIDKGEKNRQKIDELLRGK